MGIKTKIANDLFRQKWYRQLDADYKALWLLLTLESNIIGVFEVDSESWQLFCKSKRITDVDPFIRFGKRIQRLPKHPEKGIVVGKLDYQNSFGKNSTQWKWVEKELAAVGLTYDKLQEMKSHEEEQMEFDLEIVEEPKKEKKKDERHTIPPTVEMVRAYCSTRNNSVNADTFIDYYTSRGWSKIKDWQAAVRTWENRTKDDAKTKAKAAKVPTAVTNQPTRKVF